MTRSSQGLVHARGLAALAVWMGLITGCFPDRQVTMIDKPSMTRDLVIQSPTKAFLADATVVILPNGFTMIHGRLEGRGWTYSATSQSPPSISMSTPAPTLPLEKVQLPVDSIIAMTYYENVYTPGRSVASVFYGLTGAVLTPLSIYCLANPKACFGCCPTVYSIDGADWSFEAELFSFSVSRLLEANDLDRITRPPSADGPFLLRVANEALETHNINQLGLLAVRHPHGTTVYPTSGGEIAAVTDVRAPVAAVNSRGEDVLEWIAAQDDRAYRSDSAMVREVMSGRSADWIDLTFQAPVVSSSLTLVLRLRNTLLSTLLFYEIVLGSQGVGAIEWTERMNKDPLYASLFRSVYDEFSGVKILVQNNGRWVPVAMIRDVGPVGWKSIAANVPAMPGGPVTVRLEFFPDNFLIDVVGCDRGETDGISVRVSEIPPVEVRDRTGTKRDEVASIVANADDRYLVTEPRDVYYFAYEIPKVDGEEVTLFLRSKGYYTEWLRGNWVRNQGTDHRFDLFQIDGTMGSLASLWLQERVNMESLFFRSRIPLSEGL